MDGGMEKAPAMRTSHVSVWEKTAERSNRDREQQVSILPPAGPALKW
jgi:hypothetical protein